MSIQWFPGHMTKALRMMQDNIALSDAVGYVLDARAPASSFNPELDKITGSKPCVYILNKCDLADDSKIKAWDEFFRSKGSLCVKVSATKLGDASRIASAFVEATASVSEKYRKKGIVRPVRVMILGIPNSGKSTIINCLAGKKSAITGDKPGVTKGMQWVRLSVGIDLLDTPGTVWPKFDSQTVAYRLCFVGSIKDDVVDLYDVSTNLLTQLKEQYPQLLKERYKLDSIDMDATQLHEAIARKRGFVVRGGETDWERCSKAILDDFRKGRIGKITFELPDDIARLSK